jgi:endoglucanase
LRYTRGEMGYRPRWFVAILLANATLLAQSSVTETRYAHLARGVNLTRWFQYGSRIPITAADRDLLLGAGFTNVRIAVAPQYLFEYWSSPDRIARNLAELDKGIDLFLDAGISVTLDLHADAEYLDHYLSRPGAPESLITLWRILASRYANRNPELLFFEIMNEPDDRFTEAMWDAEQKQALAAIHEIAPRHTVVLDVVRWSGLDALAAMTPYSDPNVIYALHYYSPSTFTHQGADWTGKPGMAELRNVPWPAFLPGLQSAIGQEISAPARALLMKYRDEDWDADRIGWDMQLAAAWAKRWSVRVVVNEFGDFKPFSPPDSRVRWLHDVRMALDKQKLGWAVWDYGAGFDLTAVTDGVRTIDPAVGVALGLNPFQAWTSADPVRQQPVEMFSGPRAVQLGAQPETSGFAEGILVADVNGDGLPDVVITPMTWPELPEHAVQVFVNSGGGILQPALFSGPAPMVRSVESIVSGRFDGSGRPGFFLPDAGPGDGSGAQSRLVLPAEGDGVRDATANLPQEAVVARGAAAGDVDGDGFDDITVFRPQGVQLLRNDGAGRFRVDPEAFPAWASDPQQENNRFGCGVFVKRGDRAMRDLLVFGKSGTPARVFLNDGRGHFHDGAFLPVAAANSGPVNGGCAAVADLDGDGAPDVVVGYMHPAADQPDVLQILMNNGDGTFRDETAMRAAALPVSRGGLRRIALARGKQGWMLVATRVGEAPTIQVEHGDGVFKDSGWRGADDPWVVAPGDFNGDGLVDLVFGQGGGAPLVARFGR